MSSVEQSFDFIALFLLRNKQVHFFIVLTSEWFFSKSPRCQWLKINFKLRFSQLLHSGSSQQPLIIGEKNKNGVMTLFNDVNTFLQLCSLFCHFWEILNLFVFLITLSVLMLKKWNFAVIFIRSKT